MLHKIQVLHAHEAWQQEQQLPLHCQAELSQLQHNYAQHLPSCPSRHPLHCHFLPCLGTPLLPCCMDLASVDPLKLLPQCCQAFWSNPGGRHHPPPLPPPQPLSLTHNPALGKAQMCHSCTPLQQTPSIHTQATHTYVQLVCQLPPPQVSHTLHRVPNKKCSMCSLLNKNGHCRLVHTVAQGLCSLWFAQVQSR